MIYPAREETGVYFINGKGINLKSWRAGQRYSLTAFEIEELNDYIKEKKLDLS
jgi:hypothetical protein